jgi:hypothetical protein
LVRSSAGFAEVFCSGHVSLDRRPAVAVPFTGLEGCRMIDFADSAEYFVHPPRSDAQELGPFGH